MPSGVTGNPCDSIVCGLGNVSISRIVKGEIVYENISRYNCCCSSGSAGVPSSLLIGMRLKMSWSVVA